MCLPGHFCPVGTAYPIPCHNGTYQTQPGQDTCVECPEGFYCDPAEGPVVNPKPCPAGHYCPLGTSYRMSFACPAGTFGPGQGYSNITQCQPCLPGSYCAVSGLSNVTGLCYAGYYCMTGAKDPAPFEDDPIVGGNFDFQNDLCPKGFYCTNGTANPTPCPRGRYSGQSGLKQELECQECPPGKYCAVEAAKELKNPPNCSEGYVCLGGAFKPTPDDDQTGYICPKGFYCPLGEYIKSLSFF